MTPHEIIAGLVAGIDDAEDSPVWDSTLLAAARDYLASPEGPPAPLPEPDQPAPGRREAMSEWPNPGAAKAAIERLQEQAQQAESRAERAEAREAELRGMLEDAVTDLENMADETDAPESHKRSPSSFWRSRARYYQDALSPSPVAEALERLVEAATDAEFVRWMEARLDVPTHDFIHALRALQAARAGRREGERRGAPMTGRKDAGALARALGEAAGLREAGEAVIADPYGCPRCDSGVLRNPDRGHTDDCEFALLLSALASSPLSKLAGEVLGAVGDLFGPQKPGDSKTGEGGALDRLKERWIELEKLSKGESA